MRIVLDRTFVTTDGASEAGTAAECTVLQRCGPVGATPNRRPPEIPSGFDNKPQSISKERDLHVGAGFLRALVPVGRDPLEVEVDEGPQDVSDPRSVVLFGFGQPLRVLEMDIRTERGPSALRSESDPKTTKY